MEIKPQNIPLKKHCSGSGAVFLFKDMAGKEAKQFYSSKQWQDTRNAYASSVRYLCENCLRNGIINTGEIVHHKKEITPETLNDTEITLSFDNLELLCRKCHGAIHGKKRFSILADGTVLPIAGKNL